MELRLWTESGGLLFSVTDDGPGFDPAVARRGHGFVNMADRLGAIGGTVRWDSTAGARRRGQRVGPAGRLGLLPTQVHSRAKAPESRSCHSWRSASAPKRSLFTYPLAPLTVALRGRSARS